MKALTFVLILAFIMDDSLAQQSQDRASILDFCGCYEVSFQFAETFSPDPNYVFKENYYSSGLEWIVPIADEEDFVSLQHLLIVGHGDQKSIVKHWRQDWQFENTDIYAFAGDHRWNYRELDEATVKGQWTQKVYEVSDAPRYEGSATWVHSDGRHYWESTTDAPLPRREYTKRDDYNVMQRTNHHEITAEGHRHEQDNVKISRKAGRERIRAYEKGMNVYKKVDDAQCQLAQEWWAQHHYFWADVRAVWQEVFAKKEALVLHPKVDGKPMFMHLFPLGEEMSKLENYDSKLARNKIREILHMYLARDESIGGK